MAGLVKNSSNLLRSVSALSKRSFASTGSLVDVQLNDKTGVSVVTMQRAPVNSLNLELLTELQNTFKELEKSKCRGMILTSALPTIFSAGLDIMEMYKPKPDRVRSFWSTLQDMWLQLYSSSFPTVAVINGHSPAGGCLMACACEHRVMVKGKFTIGLNETQLGIVPPKWFMDSFKAIVPNRTAEVALTTGKLFTVDEALSVGLIDKTANDKTEALALAEEFLAQFAKISPAARKMTKLTFRQEAIDWLVANKEKDIQIFLQFTNSPQVQKGLELYLASLKNK